MSTTADSNKLGGTGPSSNRMKGAAGFIRHNPKSDRFNILDFDHVEIWCTDAKSTAARFCASFGFHVQATADIDSGCFKYTAVVVGSGSLRFLCVAPYNTNAPLTDAATKFQDPLPAFDKEECFKFIERHGTAGRAIGLKVDDAAKAYEEATKHGGKGILPATTFKDADGEVTYSEVTFYDDVKFRFTQRTAAFKGTFLPNMKSMPTTMPDGSPIPSFGIGRIDHIVSNVPNLCELADSVNSMIGLHEFAEFTAEDVGTVDSGLNSMVMANNTETVLMPINEPTTGTRRKSQIQSFLEHHKGGGMQHIAITTPDIVATVEQMAKSSLFGGGVTFMAHPGKDYYQNHVPRKMGDMVTPEIIAQCDKFGILIDRDEEGGLLQIFTKPIFDRPTLFLEVIQRIGCIQPDGTQKPACGGFGKGNFGALFKSIEDWEKQRDGELPQM